MDIRQKTKFCLDIARSLNEMWNIFSQFHAFLSLWKRQNYSLIFRTFNTEL